MIREFDETNDILFRSAWKSQFLSGMMMPIMQFVGNLGYVGVSILGGYLAIKQTIEVGDIQSFIQYVRSFTQPIQQVAQVANMLQCSGSMVSLNIMTGCLSATSGTVTIGGYDIFEHPMEAKKLIGYLPEQPPLYLEETPREYLRFIAEAKKVPRERLTDEVERVMKETQISDVADRLIKNLSKGYKQRVGIAQTLLGSRRSSSSTSQPWARPDPGGGDPRPDQEPRETAHGYPEQPHPVGSPADVR